MRIQTFSATASALALCILVSPLQAQESKREAALALSEVTILGQRRDAEDIAGSAHRLDPDELQQFATGDILRALRAVPGVYVQDEEGFGLRPNIGIRGSGLDRSSRIALLEDGVLIAPAPYAAPSAYYFPTQRRMHSLEVLKGPSAIVIGPRTTGGALNMISTPVPDRLLIEADWRVGSNQASDLVARVGNSGEQFGFLLETVQQQSDGFKTVAAPGDFPTGFELEDYVAKLRWQSERNSTYRQSLMLKLGHTTQTSDETYLGLTDADFASDPFQRYAASQLDQINTEHDQVQINYSIDLPSGTTLQLTAYRNDFERNWFKLNDINGVGISAILDDPTTYAAELDIARGGNSAADAVVNRNNARTYESEGIQARAIHSLTLGQTEIDLTLGIRSHEDNEDRLQDDDSYQMINGLLSLTTDGAPGSATNRLSTADVTAYFIDSRIYAGRWEFTPGVRFEQIDLTRFDYSTADPARAQGATRVRENSVDALIPGFGVAYNLNDAWRLIGSINKGFNPPSPGSSAGEEESLNFELGARYQSAGASFNAIAFVNDFDNLVGTVTASTGGDAQIGDQFDGGDALVRGLEIDGGYTLFQTDGGWQFPLTASYTWTETAEFRSNFASDFEPWGNVTSGDALPYVPEHQLRATAAMQNEQWQFNVSAAYVDETRTVAGSGAIPPGQGTDSFVVWDALAGWQATPSLRGYIKVDNLFDREYAVARRPAGLRPGLPRIAYVGVNYQF